MKTEILRDHDSISDYLCGLSADELVDIHNHYCREANYPDDEIYENGEDFFSTYFLQAYDAIRAISYGDYEYLHEYVKFNGYANLDTTNNPSKWIDTSDIVEHILENEHLYDDIELVDEEDED
ncbi:MAG: hypothetical protein WD512_12845 [Candidatus Paceibacterota bacterium]